MNERLIKVDVDKLIQEDKPFVIAFRNLIIETLQDLDYNKDIIIMIEKEIDNFESLVYNNEINYDHRFKRMQFHINGVAKYHCDIYPSEAHTVEETIMVKNGPIIEIKYFLENGNVHFDNINVELVHYLSTI